MSKRLSEYHEDCFSYVNSVLSGEKLAGKEIVEACERFMNDLKNPDFEFREKEANFVCAIVERTMFHKQGEDLDGRPLKGKPFVLQPWQIFIVYNICGFSRLEQKNADSKKRLYSSLVKTEKRVSLQLWLMGLLCFRESQGQRCTLLQQHRNRRIRASIL